MCIIRWKGEGVHNALKCIGTHSQPALQNRLMVVYETCRDKVFMTRTWIKVFQGMDPGWDKYRLWRGLFHKGRSYDHNCKLHNTSDLKALKEKRYMYCYFGQGRYHQNEFNPKHIRIPASQHDTIPYFKGIRWETGFRTDCF